MICRAVVGWGGKGVRGDTDRIGAKLLGGHPQQHPGQPVRAGPDHDRAAGPGRRSGRPRLRPLRVRVGARAGVLLPEVRHAPPPRLSAGDRPMPAYDYDCAACGRRFEVMPRRLRRRTDDLPVVRQGPGPQGDHRRRDPLQGIGLGQEGTPRDAPRRVGAKAAGRRVRVRASGSSTVATAVRRRDGGSASDRQVARRRRRADVDSGSSRQGRPSPVDPGQARRLTERCPPPTDWITLAEAAEILAAANVHFTPGDDRRLGSRGPAPEHQARRPPVRPARRGPGARRRAATRAGRGRPAGPVRGPGRLIPADRWTPARILATVLDQPRVARVMRGPRHLRPRRRRAAGQRPRILGAVRRDPDRAPRPRRRPASSPPATRTARDRLVQALIEAFPPLADLIDGAVDGLQPGRRADLDHRVRRRHLDGQPVLRRARRRVRADLRRIA